MMTAFPLASARLSKLWIQFLNHYLDGYLCKNFFYFHIFFFCFQSRFHNMNWYFPYRSIKHSDLIAAVKCYGSSPHLYADDTLVSDSGMHHCQRRGWVNPTQIRGTRVSRGSVYPPIRGVNISLSARYGWKRLTSSSSSSSYSFNKWLVNRNHHTTQKM